MPVAPVKTGILLYPYNAGCPPTRGGGGICCKADPLYRGVFLSKEVAMKYVVTKKSVYEYIITPEAQQSIMGSRYYEESVVSGGNDPIKLRCFCKDLIVYYLDAVDGLGDPDNVVQDITETMVVEEPGDIMTQELELV